ncbi:E3 ubiquitin-protein ligase TRIM45-like isoform X2 [Linepithema humile]|uniref:E3 ubiquitin-protein ligase TRIM45-like isoform X2 n=1 Tax=Linepithema humile TaxID=83485 RepID=UPI00351E055A
MDFLSCLTKYPSKSCCDRETAISSELGSCDHIYASLIECKNKGINKDFIYLEPVSIAYPNKRNEDSRKKRASSLTNSNIFTYQSPPCLTSKIGSKVDKESKEITYSPYNLLRDADFQCPRCEQRMEEPRLLPCLHPICLLCVYQLMNKSSPHIFSKSDVRDNRTYARADIHEICPLCDSHLPNVNSSVPPPHYPLQHRLIINTVRGKLVNRILCDICVDEVPALIQCSTCLRNFCSKCGKRHEQQNVAEARSIKHLMRPLWEATKVRRTILCQRHPTHVLKFYCIACQQVYKTLFSTHDIFQNKSTKHEKNQL